MNALADAGPVWLVGCGKLGQALLAGWIAGGLPPSTLTVINPSPRVLPEGVGYAARLEDIAGDPPRVAVLAVKPARLGEVAAGLAPRLGGGLLLSVLAGVTLSQLGRAFPQARVVRAMPNTAARIGRSVTLGAWREELPPAEVALARALISAIGSVEPVPETHFDAATALAASGPAFLFRMIDALAEAGGRAGLEPGQAARLALGMVTGSAALAGADPRTPAALAAEVASPGGMTQAGLNVLDSSAALTDLMERTLAAAIARARELGQEAEGR